MLTMAEVEGIERDYYRCICAAGDSGNLSLIDVADLAARKLSLLLTEHKQLLEQHTMLLAERGAVEGMVPAV